MSGFPFLLALEADIHSWVKFILIFTKLELDLYKLSLFCFRNTLCLLDPFIPPRG